MPDATPFVAVGHFNGFPFDEYPSFVTPTLPEEAAVYISSIDLGTAMSIWWNVYSIRVEAAWEVTYSDPDDPEIVLTDSTGALDITALFGSSARLAAITAEGTSVTVPIEPVERAAMLNLIGDVYYGITAVKYHNVGTLNEEGLGVSVDETSVFAMDSDPSLRAVAFPVNFYAERENAFASIGGGNGPTDELIDPALTVEKTVTMFGQSKTFYIQPLFSQAQPLTLDVTDFTVTIEMWSYPVS